MVEKPTFDETELDPLHDTAEEERVKLAKLREAKTARDGDGTWTANDGHVSAYRADPTATTQSNYLFGRAGEGDRPLWSDSVKGRIAIRLISRGIVGTAMMALTDIATADHLKNYEPEKAWGELKAWGKVAKTIDAVLTKPIHAGVKLFARPEHAPEYAYNATRFRPKAYYHDRMGQPVGRSLGAEIVAVTAGFSAASLGDATVRNLVQMIDPNSIKSWMVNDRGEPAKPGEKKHFVFDKWAKATFQNTWRIVTKNAGEDWAVALPYVYQMRWQRNILSKWHPDSKLMFDNSNNGGSMYLNEQGEVIGDFHKVGAADLHMRFVGYNIGTLMYREAYDAIGRGLKNWMHNDFKIQLPSNPVVAAVDAVGYGARYVVKSAIKATIYMTPAVIPFWVTRVSQSKWRAGAIMEKQKPGQNAIAMANSREEVCNNYINAKYNTGRDASIVEAESHMFVNEPSLRHTYQMTHYPSDPGFTRHAVDAQGKPRTIMHFYQKRAELDGQGKPVYVDRQIEAPEMFKRRGGVFGKEYMSNPNISLFSKALNPFGWASYQAGSALTRAVGTFRTMTPRLETELRKAADISMAYTPYMILKAETALRVDERPADGGLGETDKDIYRGIDALAKLDFKGFVAAVKDTARDSMNMTRTVTSREGSDPTPVVATRPDTTVRAGDAKHDGKKVAANNNEVIANDNESTADTRKWAESVAGRDLDGRYQHASHSLH